MYEKITKNKKIVMIVKDGGMFIPASERNRDYREFLEWHKENKKKKLKEFGKGVKPL